MSTYQEKTLKQNLLPKLAGGALGSFAMWGITQFVGFPPIYQLMFVVFVLLAAAFCFVLDLPPMKETSGTNTAANFIFFYLGVSVILYTIGANMPQYNPKYEIEKLYRKPGTLTENASKDEFIAAGKKLFVDFECSNCHIAEGQGGNRAPNLDKTDTGDLKKIEESILDPRKEIPPEYDKPKLRDAMPDDYGKDLKGLPLKAMVLYLDFLAKNSRGEVVEVTKERMPKGWWTDPEVYKRGKMIYEGLVSPEVNCAVCHGKDGTPLLTGARDFRDANIVDHWNDAEWFAKIENGKPGTPMPAWGAKLSIKDIWALISYTHGFSREGRLEEPKAKAKIIK